MNCVVILFLASGCFCSYSTENQNDKVLSGRFQKRMGQVSGGFNIRKLGGRYLLEFESDFSISSGIDLRVYFSPRPFDKMTAEYATKGHVLKVGLLKSRKGRQIYHLPDRFRPTRNRSLYIYSVKSGRLWVGSNLR